MDASQMELVLRLVLAALLGAALGLEREARGHPGGLRMHALVAVGAALFTIAGAYGFGGHEAHPSTDPARVAAQVASGVGFLGAGAIIKIGVSVKGLTTAATLWLAAAVGVALGAGAYLAGVAGVLAVLALLTGFRLLLPWVHRVAGRQVLVEVEYRRGHGTLGPLLRTLQEGEGRLADIQIEDEDGESRLRRVQLTMIAREPGAVDRVLECLRDRDEVLHTRVSAARE